MKSIIKFIILTIFLIISAATFFPLLLLVIDAIDKSEDNEDGVLVTMYKNI